VNETPGDIEDRIRSTARGLLAQCGVSQDELGKGMGVSQSAVSNMLGRRSYGMTATETWAVEKACNVPPGTIWRLAGAYELPAIEDQVYGIPGIVAQTAEVLVAAIQAAKASGLRGGGGGFYVQVRPS
jgi:hypothetical protein